MPIVRKILSIGNSKAISLPKSWLEFFEKETGSKITEVAIEVDNVLTITPIIPSACAVQAALKGEKHG